MAFFKSLIIASVAAVALAQGGASDNNKKVEVDTKAGDYKCGNGQKVACCNSGEDLIGLNCLSVPIRMSLSSLFPQISISIVATGPQSLTVLLHSRHPHPEGLRFQRRRLLRDWRLRRQPPQPRGQLPCHPSLSVFTQALSCR